LSLKDDQGENAQMVSSKDVEAVKRQLKKAEQSDIHNRAREAKLTKYRKRLDAGAGKSKSNAAKRDLFTRARRLPGALGTLDLTPVLVRNGLRVRG
jgi:hypothetical protein